MSAVPDARYAQQLLDILSTDRERLRSQPTHAAVVLWMVEEVRAAASRLTLDRGVAQSMLLEAAHARRDALDTRRRAREKGRRRAA